MSNYQDCTFKRKKWEDITSLPTGWYYGRRKGQDTEIGPVFVMEDTVLDVPHVSSVSDWEIFGSVPKCEEEEG